MSEQLKKRIQELIYERDLLTEENNKLKDIILSDKDIIVELRGEVYKLKQLLNEGHASLMKENEQLRWANAIKDSMLYIQDKAKKPKE